VAGVECVAQSYGQWTFGAEMNLTGRLFDIGTLEDEKVGFSMRLGTSRIITVTGLEHDEVKALAPLFGKSVTLVIGSPLSAGTNHEHE